MSLKKQKGNSYVNREAEGERMNEYKPNQTPNELWFTEDSGMSNNSMNPQDDKPEQAIEPEYCPKHHIIYSECGCQPEVEPECKTCKDEKELFLSCEECNSNPEECEQACPRLASAEKRTIAIRIRRNIAEKKVQWLTEENNTKENEIRILKEKIEIYERFKGKTNAELAIKLDAAEKKLQEKEELLFAYESTRTPLNPLVKKQAEQIEKLREEIKRLNNLIIRSCNERDDAAEKHLEQVQQLAEQIEELKIKNKNLKE